MIAAASRMNLCVDAASAIPDLPSLTALPVRY
jgi:hypothetical protein